VRKCGSQPYFLNPAVQLTTTVIGAAEVWSNARDRKLEEREKDLLPTRCVHVVFTLPRHGPAGASNACPLLFLTKLSEIQSLAIVDYTILTRRIASFDRLIVQLCFPARLVSSTMLHLFVPAPLRFLKYSGQFTTIFNCVTTEVSALFIITNRWPSGATSYAGNPGKPCA
jgi:hypothetical protein